MSPTRTHRPAPPGQSTASAADAFAGQGKERSDCSEIQRAAAGRPQDDRATRGIAAGAAISRRTAGEIAAAGATCTASSECAEEDRGGIEGQAGPGPRDAECNRSADTGPAHASSSAITDRVAEAARAACTACARRIEVHGTERAQHRARARDREIYRAALPDPAGRGDAGSGPAEARTAGAAGQHVEEKQADNLALGIDRDIAAQTRAAGAAKAGTAPTAPNASIAGAAAKTRSIERKRVGHE